MTSRASSIGGSPEQKARIDSLLDRALDTAPEARDAWLAQECGGDDTLRATVLRLIDHASRPATWLETPPIAILQDDGASEEWEPDFDTLGPYRVLREIGRGGMGVVYLAEREDDYHRLVAIKVMHPWTRNAETLRRFSQERQIIANLEDPHIARLYDAGMTPDGRPYSVMEYVDGVPIDEYADARSLSLRERLELFSRVAGAVHYAHQALVVHRDIKPSNVLVGVDGAPKLLDFGIAKWLDSDDEATTAVAQRPFTPGYASPEQLRGDTVTTASDVFQLGAMLFELLCGARARPRELASASTLDALHKAEQAVPRPSAAVSEMPDEPPWAWRDRDKRPSRD
jgi:serine/threonine protein kinase